MQNKPIPTVKIEAKTAKGYRVINESDFDPKLHRKFGASPLPKKTAKRAK